MDPEIIISSHLNGVINVYDLKSGNSIAEYRTKSSNPKCLSVVGDDYIASARVSEPVIDFFGIQRKWQSDHQIVVPGKVSCMAISASGTYCVVAIDEKIHIWEIPTGNYLSILDCHTNDVTCIKFSYNDLYFISGGSDAVVLVWMLADVISVYNDRKRPHFEWLDHMAAVTDIFISTLGSHVFTTSLDKTCKVYDLQNGNLLHSLNMAVCLTSVVVDMMNCVLILGDINGFIHKLDISDSDEPRKKVSKLSVKAHESSVISLSMDCTGMTVLSLSESGICKLWNVPNLLLCLTIEKSVPMTNASLVDRPLALAYEKSPKFTVAPFELKYSGHRKPKFKDLVFAQDIVASQKTTLFHFESFDKMYPSTVLQVPLSKLEGDINLLRETASDLRTINAQLFSHNLQGDSDEENEEQSLSVQ